ncbi:MAG TPA: hypothetical protein VLL54_06665 [Pyrinomonadaceae bacterium]|nr:hypothetical protein [Pyrinomonadaceae bacterium]
MKIVNETGIEIFYSISCATSADCGTIGPDDIADLPYYDNQESVSFSVAPNQEDTYFAVTIPQTDTGKQVEFALVFE